MVSGTIPTCSDDNPGNAFLTTFDIRESRVSGHIPDLRRFQGLQVLSMSSLDLHGTLNELPSNMAYLSIQGTQVAGNLDGLAKLPLRKVLAAGNKLDGSIPHELFDSDIEQVQLSQNMIRGSIPTEINRATNLTYLVLTDNSINGELPGELSNILSNLNKIQLDLNQISCDLKPSLRDWSAVKATVRVLNGNIFGCTGLESLQEKDENGDSYVCPEDAYIVPLVMAVMAVATVLAALCCSCRYACMRDEPRAFLYWCKAEDANIVQRTSANTWKLGIMVAIMSALIVAVGVPTYVYADSSVTCQYFDTYSIAFLSAFENDFKAMHSPTGWIILFLLVACMAATVGFVKRSHDVVIQKFSENKARTSGMQGTALSMQSPADGKGEGKEDRGRTCCDIFKLIVVIVLVCVLLVIVQAVSSVFQVIIDISTAIPESWKLFLAFLLAGFQTFSSVVIVPEGVENLGVFVSKLLEASHDHTSASVLVKGRDLAWRAMTMGLATASFEVIGSIFAPLLAQLFIDSSCLRPLFEGKETYESTSLSTNVCGVYEGNWVYDSQGVYRQSWFCSRLLTVDSGEYTPNFRFRRDYCASRVVSTFTPFFIASVIFIAAMPLINLFLPWCFRRPPSCSKISFCGCCTLDVFKENLITIWPDSTNDFSDDEIAEMTNMLLIKDRNLVLILLGVNQPRRDQHLSTAKPHSHKPTRKECSLSFVGPLPFEPAMACLTWAMNQSLRLCLRWE
uniref:Uncharacterized protein n=1 Tax=Lotharella globosa TaxID=91324 RepID=A0A7S3Z7A9_9EUKA